MSYSDSSTAFNTPMDMMLNIAVSLGIAPPRTTDYPVESDHGILNQVVINTARSMQTRGWWFNTTFGEKLEPDEFAELHVADALKVTPCKHQASYNDPHLRLGTPDSLGVVPLINMSEAANDWMAALQADVTRFVPMAECPGVFQDYVVWRVINKMATVYGVPKDFDSEAQAWSDLLRTDGDLAPSTNVFTHPSLARTVSN